MAADTYLKIGGLYHLRYQAVSVTLGGIDMGDFVVDVNGQVSVAFGADSGGIVTATYLSSLSPWTGENQADAYFDDGSGAKWYTVPCVVGLPFTSRAQTLRPATADDIKSPSGPALAKTRRVYEYGAVVNNCIAMTFGIDYAGSQRAAQFRVVYTAPSTAYDATTLFSGVIWGDIVSESNFDNRVAWEVTRPVPATVCALTAFLEGQER